MDFVNRNIVILPSPAEAAQLRMLSETIAEGHPSDVVLDDAHTLPHLSLYNTAFPEDSIEEVHEQLLALTRDERAFRMTTTVGQMYGSYAFLNATVNERLQGLHERILTALNPLRQGQTPSVLPTNLNAEELRRVQELGMLLAGPAFLPHFTVGHVADETAHPEVVELITALPTLRTTVDAIHLVETGPYGTCVNVLESFPFGG